MRHISFPDIEQFRHIVFNVNRKYNFVGLDEQGDPIYDESRSKPTLHFTGTVKLHGTNMGVCYNHIDGLWVQSREGIITIENDNAGAAFFVEANKDAIMELFTQVGEKYGIDFNDNTASIYGEWVGKGIQKGVGINNLNKSMFIIGLKISPFNLDKDHPAYWLDSSSLRNANARIYNIQDYKKYSIDIDFNDPKAVQDKIIEMTIEVEDECPVSKEFFNDAMDNIIYEENGKVWFKKENGFTDTLKPFFTDKIKELRYKYSTGINYIKFNLLN